MDAQANKGLLLRYADTLARPSMPTGRPTEARQGCQKRQARVLAPKRGNPPGPRCRKLPLPRRPLYKASRRRSLSVSVPLQIIPPLAARSNRHYPPQAPPSRPSSLSIAPPGPSPSRPQQNRSPHLARAAAAKDRRRRRRRTAEGSKQATTWTGRPRRRGRTWTRTAWRTCSGGWTSRTWPRRPRSCAAAGAAPPPTRPCGEPSTSAATTSRASCPGARWPPPSRAATACAGSASRVSSGSAPPARRAPPTTSRFRRSSPRRPTSSTAFPSSARGCGGWRSRRSPPATRRAWRTWSRGGRCWSTWSWTPSRRPPRSRPSPSSWGSTAATSPASRPPAPSSRRTRRRWRARYPGSGRCASTGPTCPNRSCSPSSPAAGSSGSSPRGAASGSTRPTRRWPGAGPGSGASTSEGPGCSTSSTTTRWLAPTSATPPTSM